MVALPKVSRCDSRGFIQRICSSNREEIRILRLESNYQTPILTARRTIQRLPSPP